MLYDLEAACALGQELVFVAAISWDQVRFL